MSVASLKYDNLFLVFSVSFSDGIEPVYEADGDNGCWLRSLGGWRNLWRKAVEDNCSTLVDCNLGQDFLQLL